MLGSNKQNSRGRAALPSRLCKQAREGVVARIDDRPPDLGSIEQVSMRLVTTTSNNLLFGLQK
jgi:hypothetical protein